MSSDQIIAALWNDPKKVDADLQSFRESAQILSQKFPRMIDLYPDEWVALFDGEVRAHGPSLDEVLQKIDLEGIAREGAIVRFIQSKPRTMIL